MNQTSTSNPPELAPLKVAMLGCGTVGTQVARLITQSGDDLRERIGRPIELVGIAVRDAIKQRDGIDPQLFTTDALGLVTRGDLDVVVELIGGIEEVRPLVLAAIESGASVVTANKALLAADADTLSQAADKAGVDLYYEAAVAGAIPIVRPLRESLVGDEIITVMGIVNGTTNFILDKMCTTGADFDETLAEAQALGYAEADPTADVEGYDAAAKAAILASLAFHTRVRAADVYREGITRIAAQDIRQARVNGCVVKLLAIASSLPDGKVSVRVHPAMVPNSHPLASVSGAYIAVFVESREAGRLMFMGPGAGGAPTASAVMGDLVTVGRNRVRGVAARGHNVYAHRPIASMGDVHTRYAVSAEVADEPGVLAAVASCFAEHGVSLQTVDQELGASTDHPTATIQVTTHQANEADVQACVDELGLRSFIHGQVRVLRVEGN